MNYVQKNTYVATACMALALLGIASLQVLENLENGAEKESAQTPNKQEISENTEKMGGLEFAQTVPDDATEQALLAMMHKMTHQK